jgi:superfamily II DNA or RNA helicase
MLVIPEKRKIIIDSNVNDTAANFIPHARRMKHEGKNLLVVPYGVEESIVLKNIGFEVSAPIHHYYDWPARFSPMVHQQETSAFLTMNKRALYLNAPGTGKSISALWAADFLLTEKVAKKVLIIAPLSTLKVVWGRELKHHLPHRSFTICTGSRQKRKELLETPGVHYVIINHDGFTTMVDELNEFDVVIYD